MTCKDGTQIHYQAHLKAVRRKDAGLRDEVKTLCQGTVMRQHRWKRDQILQQRIRFSPEIRLGPPLHDHAVEQTGRLDRHVIIIERAVRESRPDGIRARVIFRT